MSDANNVTMSFKGSRSLEDRLERAVSGRYTSRSEGIRSIVLLGLDVVESKGDSLRVLSESGGSE